MKAALEGVVIIVGFSFRGHYTKNESRFEHVQKFKSRPNGKYWRTSFS